MMLHFVVHRAYQGFPTRMVYLFYISYLRVTILVGNPRYVVIHVVDILLIVLIYSEHAMNQSMKVPRFVSQSVVMINP